MCARFIQDLSYCINTAVITRHYKLVVFCLDRPAMKFADLPKISHPVDLDQPLKLQKSRQSTQLDFSGLKVPLANFFANKIAAILRIRFFAIKDDRILQKKCDCSSRKPASVGFIRVRYKLIKLL